MGKPACGAGDTEGYHENAPSSHRPFLAWNNLLAWVIPRQD